MSTPLQTQLTFSSGAEVTGVEYIECVVIDPPADGKATQRIVFKDTNEGIAEGDNDITFDVGELPNPGAESTVLVVVHGADGVDSDALAAGKVVVTFQGKLLFQLSRFLTILLEEYIAYQKTHTHIYYKSRNTLKIKRIEKLKIDIINLSYQAHDDVGRRPRYSATANRDQSETGRQRERVRRRNVLHPGLRSQSESTRAVRGPRGRSRGRNGSAVRWDSGYSECRRYFVVFII